MGIRPTVCRGESPGGSPRLAHLDQRPRGRQADSGILSSSVRARAATASSRLADPTATMKPSVPAAEKRTNRSASPRAAMTRGIARSARGPKLGQPDPRVFAHARTRIAERRDQQADGLVNFPGWDVAPQRRCGLSANIGRLIRPQEAAQSSSRAPNVESRPQAHREDRDRDGQCTQPERRSWQLDTHRTVPISKPLPRSLAGLPERGVVARSAGKAIAPGVALLQL